MLTTQNQPEIKRWWNDWGLFKYHFIRSNYITALWNWFIGLAGKAAEPVLFGSVLYSGYQLVPGVLQPTPAINAFMFVIQQAALDVGGLGLIKLTKDEDPGKFQFARWTGYALITLMVFNMVVATTGRVFSVPAGAMQVTEGVLLIIRSVMSVLFGHAIHSLKDEEIGGGSAEVVKVTDMGELFGQMSEQVNYLASQIQMVQSQVQLAVQPQLQEVSEVVQKIPLLVQQDVNLLVQESVQPLLREQVQTVAQLLENGDSSTAMRQLEERMQEVTSSVQEMRTTITEVRTVSQVASTPKMTRTSSQTRAFDPSKVVHSLPINESGELDSEPVGDRVRRFIAEQIELGRTPSLNEIMNQCKCSKNTAIKCRRELLPDESELVG